MFPAIVLICTCTWHSRHFTGRPETPLSLSVCLFPASPLLLREEQGQLPFLPFPHALRSSILQLHRFELTLCSWGKWVLISAWAHPFSQQIPLSLLLSLVAGIISSFKAFFRTPQGLPTFPVHHASDLRSFLPSPHIATSISLHLLFVALSHCKKTTHRNHLREEGSFWLVVSNGFTPSW